MRLFLAILMVFGLSLTLSATQGGQKPEEKKEVTLKGKICCAKCELGVEKECMTVIVAKEANKDVTFYFDKAGHKTNHATICGDAKKGSVIGTVTEEGKKKIVTVKTVKFD